MAAFIKARRTSSEGPSSVASAKSQMGWDKRIPPGSQYGCHPQGAGTWRYNQVSARHNRGVNGISKDKLAGWQTKARPRSGG